MPWMPSTTAAARSARVPGKTIADSCCERVHPGGNADAGSGEKTQEYDR